MIWRFVFIASTGAMLASAAMDAWWPFTVTFCLWIGSGFVCFGDPRDPK